MEANTNNNPNETDEEINNNNEYIKQEDITNKRAGSVTAGNKYREELYAGESSHRFDIDIDKSSLIGLIPDNNILN